MIILWPFGEGTVAETLIVQRTQAGLKVAKNRGTKLGRKPSLSQDQRKHARELISNGESPATLAKLLMYAVQLSKKA